MSVGLRLHRDGEYHQYFEALASGIALRHLSPRPGDEFWKRFVELAAKKVEEWVREGGRPLEESIMAIHLTPSVEEAQRLSRGSASNLPTLPRDDFPIEGIVVHSFSM